tara:strand:- start:892 stop:1392 length:501 start_codon:yes stop_codon:yes gene_type:complete
VLACGGQPRSRPQRGAQTNPDRPPDSSQKKLLKFSLNARIVANAALYDAEFEKSISKSGNFKTNSTFLRKGSCLFPLMCDALPALSTVYVERLLSSLRFYCAPCLPTKNRSKQKRKLRKKLRILVGWKEKHRKTLVKYADYRIKKKLRCNPEVVETMPFFRQIISP